MGRLDPECIAAGLLALIVDFKKPIYRAPSQTGRWNPKSRFDKRSSPESRDGKHPSLSLSIDGAFKFAFALSSERSQMDPTLGTQPICPKDILDI